MSKAVRFDEYGGIDVLKVVDVDRPVPQAGQALVLVKAAGINPGEAYIREGVFAQLVAGDVPVRAGQRLRRCRGRTRHRCHGFRGRRRGPGVHPQACEPGRVRRRRGDRPVRKPGNVSWEQAGSLFVAGTTAYAAVRAVSLSEGDTVVVSGAAGGVGSLVVQLAVNAGAKVIGLAGEANQAWLAEHGVIPVVYGQGVLDRIREAAGGQVDAFIDTFGADYVEIALELGVKPDRIDTIINFAAAEKYGVKIEGNMDAASVTVLAELAGLVSAGKLEVVIAKVYPLEQVQDAYRELEQRHTRGKIVLRP